MSAGTVISGGFPGRVAREVFPNQKCSGCLHYDGQAGRTGACLIGLRPDNCGSGEHPNVSYAPIARGAGSYLPDMSNHGARAQEVDQAGTSALYGLGSVRPVVVRQISLGEEHVHVVKSVLAAHRRMQKSQCRRCSMDGAHGTSPMNVEPQPCTCSPISAEVVAKAVLGGMTNAARDGLTVDGVASWVRDVAKAGFRLPAARGGAVSNGLEEDAVSADHAGGHLVPVEKGTHYTANGSYVIAPTVRGEHHVTFHPKDGGPSARLPGTFSSPGAARRAVIVHSGNRMAEGSGTAGPTASTRNMRVKNDADSVSKSFFGEDWITQFKGTKLFDAARDLREQEIALEEDDLKRRSSRMKHEKDRAAALAKLAAPEGDGWEEQHVRREKIRLKMQKLSLKLAELQQGASVSKAIDWHKEFGDHVAEEEHGGYEVTQKRRHAELTYHVGNQDHYDHHELRTTHHLGHYKDAEGAKQAAEKHHASVKDKKSPLGRWRHSYGGDGNTGHRARVDVEHGSYDAKPKGNHVKLTYRQGAKPSGDARDRRPKQSLGYHRTSDAAKQAAEAHHVATANSIAKGRPVDGGPPPRMIHPDDDVVGAPKKPKADKKPVRPAWVYGDKGK